MPTYAYDAINNAGKKTNGTVEAATADEAIKKIRAQGLFPSGVKEQKVAGGAGGGGGGKKAREQKKKKQMTFTLGGGEYEEAHALHPSIVNAPRCRSAAPSIDPDP